MTYKLLLLVFIVLYYLIYDDDLREWFASAKWGDWWEQNMSDRKQWGYVMVLFARGLRWTLMIMIAPTLYVILFGGRLSWFLFVLNILTSMFIDNELYNKRTISNIQNQLFRIALIFITWDVMLVLK